MDSLLISCCPARISFKHLNTKSIDILCITAICSFIVIFFLLLPTKIYLFTTFSQNNLLHHIFHVFFFLPSLPFYTSLTFFSLQNSLFHYADGHPIFLYIFVVILSASTSYIMDYLIFLSSRLFLSLSIVDSLSYTSSTTFFDCVIFLHLLSLYIFVIFLCLCLLLPL